MSKKHVRNANLRLRALLLSVIFSAVFGLGACRPELEETNLAFETIEQKEWAGTGKSYDAREPGLMIVSHLEEVNNLNGLISDEAWKKLQAVDYDDYFILAVFQGWKPSTGYSVQVNRITRLGNTVNIYPRFHEPKPDEAKADEVTSPYHLVQVEKIGTWGQEVTFNLFADETVVVSRSHIIP